MFFSAPKKGAEKNNVAKSRSPAPETIQVKEWQISTLHLSHKASLFSCPSILSYSYVSYVCSVQLLCPCTYSNMFTYWSFMTYLNHKKCNSSPQFLRMWPQLILSFSVQRHHPDSLSSWKVLGTGVFYINLQWETARAATVTRLIIWISSTSNWNIINDTSFTWLVKFVTPY